MKLQVVHFFLSGLQKIIARENGKNRGTYDAPVLSSMILTEPALFYKSHFFLLYNRESVTERTSAFGSQIKQSLINDLLHVLLNFNKRKMLLFEIKNLVYATLTYVV